MRTSHAASGVIPKGLANGTGQGTQISKARFARLRELRIGSAILRDQIAIVTPYRWNTVQRAPHPPKAGWLGLELFERFRVTFDVARRRLELARLDAPQPRAFGAPPSQLRSTKMRRLFRARSIGETDRA